MAETPQKVSTHLVGVRPTTTQNSQLKPVDENSSSWTWFMLFINGSCLNVTEEQLREFLKEELKIAVDELPPDLYKSLPVMLVVYMRTWSGWQFRSDFAKGKFTIEHYYSKFFKFIQSKIHTVLFNGYTKAVKENKKEMENSKDSPLGHVYQKQLEQYNEQFSEFSVKLTCPPKLLNTIAFETSGDDILVKTHIGSEWKQSLNMVQLLNWPHVEVTLKTPDISISRTQRITYTRYLNYSPCKSTPVEKGLFVESATSRLNTSNRQCVTLRLLEAYIGIYLDTLKKMNNVTSGKVSEVHSIFNEFIEDIRLMGNLGITLADQTSILLKLTDSLFIRNKKLVPKETISNTREARVGYCEMLSPKVEIMLIYFEAAQAHAAKASPIVAFEHTERLKKAKSAAGDDYPQVHYKCTYCDVVFVSKSSKNEMMDHLKTAHRMEQPVRCILCKRQYEVLSLSGCRWKHICVE